MCQFLVDWYAKHKASGTKPGARAIEQVYLTLGGKFGEASAICRPDAHRDKCQRFEVVPGIYQDSTIDVLERQAPSRI